MARSASTILVTVALIVLALAVSLDVSQSAETNAPSPFIGRQIPQSMPVASVRSPNSRLFVGPFGSIASIVSSLGSVGVLGVFLLFLVFLPYIFSLFILPLFGAATPSGRSLGDTTSYYNNKHKILETLTLMEELWRKFDARDTECQKSMLCQLHLEEDNLGYLGKRAAKAISYLTYLEGVEMPQMIKNIISGYTSAIRSGRDDKVCPYTCQFSLSDTLKKMNETKLQ